MRVSKAPVFTIIHPDDVRVPHTSHTNMNSNQCHSSTSLPSRSLHTIRPTMKRQPSVCDQLPARLVPSNDSEMPPFIASQCEHSTTICSPTAPSLPPHSPRGLQHPTYTPTIYISVRVRCNSEHPPRLSFTTFQVVHR